MTEPDGCEHGATGYCGLCIAVGEGKLTPERAREIANESERTDSTFPGECDHLGYGNWSG